MCKRLIKYVINKWRWHGTCRFGWDVDISLSSTFEGMNKIYPHSVFKGEMGLGSYVGRHCFFWGKIGRFCSIAPGVEVVAGTHPYTYPFVSTSPYFYSPLRQNGHALFSKPMFDEQRYVGGGNTLSWWEMTVGLAKASGSSRV